MRKILPNFRKKFSNGRTAPNHHQRTKQDVQMYDNGDWRGASGGRTDEDASSSSHRMRSEAPYMTGALPVEFVSQPPPLGTSAGVNGNASDFTFRASSPVKMTNRLIEHQPVQLPTDPSYLRMMDGLSHDNGFDLCLKDPRKKSTEEQEFNSSITRGTGTAQNPYQTRQSPSHNRWDLGHAFLHQEPNASLRAADEHQRTSPHGKSTGFFHRAHYDPMVRSTTPALNQFQQPSRKIENVVSPFFGRSHHIAPDVSRSRITETQTSSSRSGAYRSPRHLDAQMGTEWNECSHSNGLSSINQPLDWRNNPGLHRDQLYSFRNAPSESYVSRHTHQYSQPMRPTTHRSFAINERPFRSPVNNRHIYSRQQQPQAQSATSFPSSNRVSSRRIGQLPSKMPSMISTRSPVRDQTKWGTLEHTVQRDRHQRHATTLNNSPLDAVPHVKRRSIRR
jgi:hypothetical protein